MVFQESLFKGREVAASLGCSGWKISRIFRAKNLVPKNETGNADPYPIRIIFFNDFHQRGAGNPARRCRLSFNISSVNLNNLILLRCLKAVKLECK